MSLFNEIEKYLSEISESKEHVESEGSEEKTDNIVFLNKNLN